MKNKNKVLFASTTAVAVMLSACSFTEVSVQEKFSSDISKLASAETVQGTINTSYIVDDKILKEKDFTQEEIDNLKKVLDTANFTIDYKADKQQAELIIKGEIKDEEMGIQFDIDMPMVVDLEKNKFYANLDSLMTGFSNTLLDLYKKAAIDSGEFSEEEINKEIESMKKELEDLNTKGKFMDLENLLDEESNVSSNFDILDAFEMNQYHVINKSEETIKSLVDFIKTLDVADFEENKDKNEYSLKLDEEKSKALNDITDMFPNENSKIDESDEYLFENYTKDEILVSYLSNDYFEKMGKSKISYKLKDDKLNEVTFENDFHMDGYIYTQKSHYKDLKLNETVEFKYKLSELEVLKKEETEELMGEFIMTVFMFAMMQLADSGIDEEALIDFDMDMGDESLKTEESNSEFDWDSWDE